MSLPVFLVSHLGSGVMDLVKLLNSHHKVSISCNHRIYRHPEDVIPIQRNEHIFGDVLLHNHQLASKSLYACRFIHFIRPAEASLNEIVAKYNYSVRSALRYYTYRLRRIDEMRRQTPDSIFLTWDSTANAESLPALEEFMGIDKPLEPHLDMFVNSYPRKVDAEVVALGQSCYDQISQAVFGCPQPAV